MFFGHVFSISTHCILLAYNSAFLCQLSETYKPIRMQFVLVEFYKLELLFLISFMSCYNRRYQLTSFEQAVKSVNIITRDMHIIHACISMKMMSRIDLIHSALHLCTRFRIDGIKAKPHGISGGKQVIKQTLSRLMAPFCHGCKTIGASVWPSKWQHS